VMKTDREIRKIILKYSGILELVVPDYRSLIQSYFNMNHHYPSERKQQRDLKYLKSVLHLSD
jgi:hypothetical protein